MDEIESTGFITDTLVTSNGEIKASEVEALAEMNQRGLMDAIEKGKRENALHTGKTCPFQSMDGCITECKRDCALYCGDSCAMAARRGLKKTVNMPCPFLRQCVKGCALYGENGCSLTNIAFA
jgi:hypothetical protein